MRSFRNILKGSAIFTYFLVFVCGTTITSFGEGDTEELADNNNCTEVSPLNNLTIYSSVNEIFISWIKDEVDSTSCKTNYDIFAMPLSGTQIIPYFRHENNSFHTISNLESCTKYFVSIAPTSYIAYNDSTYVEEMEISTLPSNVQNLTINFENDLTIINWEAPKYNDCITEYVVTWNSTNSVATINESLILEGNLYCITFSVFPKTEKGYLGLSENKSIPGFVRNLTAFAVESNSVLLTWNPPENADCIVQYVIELNHSLLGYTNLTEYLISNLTLCVEYSFTVTGQNEFLITGNSQSTTKMLFPKDIGTVENLQLHNIVHENEIMTFSWTSPPSFSHCTFMYIIEIATENTLSNFFYNISSNYLEFNKTNIISCSNSKIAITPVFQEDFGQKEVLFFKAPLEVREPPSLSNITYGSTWAHFEWEIVDQMENVCDVRSITLTCSWNNVTHYYKQDVIDNEDDILEIISINATGLQPFTHYLCEAMLTNDAGNSSKSFPTEITTDEDVPSNPTHLRVTTVSDTCFTLSWNHPNIIPGIQGNYKVEIYSNGPLHLIPETCNITKFYNLTYMLNSSITEWEFSKADPNFQYTVKVAASTGAGFGNYSEIYVNTSEAGPEAIRDLSFEVILYKTEEYKSEVNVSFSAPCNSNGFINSYVITLIGFRMGYPQTKYELSREKLEMVSLSLSAGYNYSLEVRADTTSCKGVSTFNYFQAPDGVPTEVKEILWEPQQVDPTTAEFLFREDIFSTENGEIIFYAIILADIEYNLSTYGFWNLSEYNWPFVGFWTSEEETLLPYQATPNYWFPSILDHDKMIKRREKKSDKSNDRPVRNFTYLLGVDDCLSHTLCNGALRQDQEYSLILRGFTRHGYRDTKPITFCMCGIESSEDQMDIVTFIGIIFGAAAVVFVSALAYIIRKKKLQKSPKIPPLPAKLSEMDNLQPIPVPLPVNKFSEYYSGLKVNNQRLKQQFALINTKSAEEMLPYYAALLPNNRKKNRYTNILPFDETRVKIVNEKEPRNDYINASFIKGYSGKIEYIATQGPLAYTCADFWKMIIQENISLIVMVAHFVEMNQPKVYKYFPNKHENMDVGQGIEVRCATELNFGTYCLRTLLIQKDLKQWTITHLQFLDWPDHGCPTGTEVMIHFCQVLRQQYIKTPGPIAVHCSAGVGRTGTLIAVDILLQTVKDKKDIDIFGTVLNLRRQRTKMVQTEKQYIYIHDCIYDVVNNPKLLDWEQKQYDSEPIYENLENIKTTTKESQL